MTSQAPPDIQSSEDGGIPPRPTATGNHRVARSGPTVAQTARGVLGKVRRVGDGVTLSPWWIAGLVTLLGFWLTRHLYGSGLPQGDDMPYHVARNSFAVHDLFLHGHLDGWSPVFNGGSQQFLIYGPGLAILSALAHVLTLGMVSQPTLIGVFASLGLVATAPAMYVLARAVRLSPVGAGVAGAMSLTVSVPFGVGVSGTFGNGLVPHQVSVPFFLLTMAGIVHLVEAPSRRWALITAGCAAMIMVTHSLSLPILAPAVALLLALGFVRIPFAFSRIGRLVVAAVAGLGVSAWWWLPLLENPGPRPPLATWGTAPFATRLKDMATGQDWAHPAIAAVTVACVAVVVIRLVATARTQRWLGNWGWAIALTGPVLLGVVQVLHYRIHGDLGLSMATRGLGYASLLCMLSVGAVADLVLDERRTSSARRTVTLRPRHVALLALACIPAFRGDLPAADRLVKAPPPSPVLVDAAKTLERVMHPDDLFAWVNESGFDQSFGLVHPDMWLVMKTGHSSLNGLGGNSVTPIDTYLPYHLTEKTPPEVTTLMDRAGVRVLIVQTSSVPKVVAPADWRTVSAEGNLTIAVRTAPNRLSVATGGATTKLAVTRWSNEAVDWKVAGGSGPTVLAIPAFTKWSVAIDGHGVPLRQQEGYTFIDVPPGAQKVTARYHRSLGDHLGVVLTLVALAVIAWAFGGNDLVRRFTSSGSAPRSDDPTASGPPDVGAAGAAGLPPPVPGGPPAAGADRPVPG